MITPPTNSLGRELPTHEDDEHDPQFDHEVGRRHHEHEHGNEVRSLDEERFGHGRGGIGARRRDHPEARRPRHRRRPVIAHLALHGRVAHEGLHHAGQGEAEDEGPECLPEHEEPLAQAAPDGIDELNPGQHDTPHRSDARRRHLGG